MATINFYAVKKDKKNLYNIMMVFQESGKKFRFSTPYRVPKNHLIKNRVKEKSLNDFKINEQLIQYECIINDIQKEAKATGFKYTIAELSKVFKHRLNRDFANNESILIDTTKNTPKADDHKSEFFNLFEYFIEQSKNTKTNSTIKDYWSCINTLKKFESFQIKK